MNQIIQASEQAASTQSDMPSLLNIIAQAAENPNVDVAKMEALLGLQERVLAKQAETEFNQALSRLMRKLPRVKKNGDVAYEDKKTGGMKSAFKFARWEDIDHAIRPLLDEEGFSLSFNTSQRQGEGGGIIVTGRLLHSAGHSMSAAIPLALDASGGKNNLQGMGSSFSYGKRYCTTMLLNLTFEGEDDDGVRGGTVYVDDAQLSQIQGLADEVGADPEAFCRFLGVNAYPDIQKKDFAKAINALMAKKSKASGGSNAKNS